jgi:hypothetical protein
MKKVKHVDTEFTVKHGDHLRVTQCHCASVFQKPKRRHETT